MILSDADCCIVLWTLHHSVIFTVWHSFAFSSAACSRSVATFLGWTCNISDGILRVTNDQIRWSCAVMWCCFLDGGCGVCHILFLWTGSTISQDCDLYIVWCYRLLWKRLLRHGWVLLLNHKHSRGFWLHSLLLYSALLSLRSLLARWGAFIGGICGRRLRRSCVSTHVATSALHAFALLFRAGLIWLLWPCASRLLWATTTSHHLRIILLLRISPFLCAAFLRFWILSHTIRQWDLVGMSRSTFVCGRNLVQSKVLHVVEQAGLSFDKSQ